MNKKDKETLTRATEILRRFFEPGNTKISRMRIQNNKWILSDLLDNLGEVIETIEKVRDNKIKEFASLGSDESKQQGVENGN